MKRLFTRLSPGQKVPAKRSPLVELRRAWRNERGVAAIEFAFVVPVLVIMLTGIIQFGAILFVQQNMGHVSRETARRLIVGDLTTAQAPQFVQDRLVNWGASYSVNATEPNGDFRVEITVPVAEVSLVDVLGLFQSGELSAVTIMRPE